jgi:hypothetical protein
MSVTRYSVPEVTAIANVVLPLPGGKSSGIESQGISELERRTIHASFSVAEQNGTHADDRGLATTDDSDGEALPAQAEFIAGRHIMALHGMDPQLLHNILLEAEREKWPLWDGLADDNGPIPTFGPVRTNECGQIVMSAQERTARAIAAKRALKAVANITDESDTDELWDEVTRGLERNS